jgi:hypothetical protein
MNAPIPKGRDSEQDEALKERLKAALSQSADNHTDTGALQTRVLAQWRQARPLGVVVSSTGPVASLQAAWRQHPVVWTGALALLVIALWLLRPVQDPVLDELMQPDVLTLISAGEL